jgi:ankyrin repeat protein
LNLDYRDVLGQTYLMYAARAGFLPAVEMLISRGVDANEMSNDGATALTFAYRYKQEVVAKFLLKSGAKPWIEKPYEPDEQSLIKELENRWK